MAKSQTWTPELTSQLVEAYAKAGKDNASLETIAKGMGKTVSMVRSKLVNLGEYQKPVEARKVGGASSVRKAHLVKQLQEATGIADLGSLEKASKLHLEALVNAIADDE